MKKLIYGGVAALIVLLMSAAIWWTLLMEDTRNKKNPYKETSYPLNGITDGQILNLFTKVDGKEPSYKEIFMALSTHSIYGFGRQTKIDVSRCNGKRIQTELRGFYNEGKK